MTRRELNDIALSLVDKYDEEKDFLIAQIDYRGHIWDGILTKQGFLNHEYESPRVFYTSYESEVFSIGCITRVWLTHERRLANWVLNEGVETVENEFGPTALLPLYNAEHCNETIKEQEKEDKTNEVINKYGLV